MHQERSGDGETCTVNAPDRGYLQDTHVRWYKDSGSHMEVIGESLLGSYVRRHRGMEALGELRHHIEADDYDTWAKIWHIQQEHDSSD